MAQTSFPFEDIDVNESQFSQWARNFQDNGVKGLPGDSNLRVTGDDSGLQVRVAAGQAFVRGHYFINSSQATVALTSAGSSTRIDAIVVDLDPALDRAILKVVEGVAAASNPTPPTLTQTDVDGYQLLLAYVTIPNDAATILAGDVTDKRTFMGNRIGVWTTDTRPADPVANFTIGYNATLGYNEVWSGTIWRPFEPTTRSSFLLMGA